MEVKLLLFSGGVESTCLAAIHRPDLLVTIDYGQISAVGEIKAAAHIADLLSIPHSVLSVQLRALGAGDLAGEIAKPDETVTEAWPFRNQMLITLAAMRFQREGYCEILIGTVSNDMIHTDGSASFIDAISKTLSTQYECMTVSAPAINMDTLSLVRESRLDRVMLGWTFSCHRANVACGVCRGCNKTLSLFERLGDTGDGRSTEQSAKPRGRA